MRTSEGKKAAATADLVYRIRYAISIDNWIEVEQLVVEANGETSTYFEVAQGICPFLTQYSVNVH